MVLFRLTTKACEVSEALVTLETVRPLREARFPIRPFNGMLYKRTTAHAITTTFTLMADMINIEFYLLMIVTFCLQSEESCLRFG